MLQFDHHFDENILIPGAIIDGASASICTILEIFALPILLTTSLSEQRAEFFIKLDPW